MKKQNQLRVPFVLWISFLVSIFNPMTTLAQVFTGNILEGSTITVSDSKGAKVYEGPVHVSNFGGHLSPCSGYAKGFANPIGKGEITVSLTSIVECSFMRISKSLLTDYDVELMNSHPAFKVSVDEYIRRWPLRARIRTADGKEYRGLWPVTESDEASFTPGDGSVFKIKAKDLGKILIDHRPRR